MLGIDARISIIVALLIAAALSFGGISHSFLPHHHSAGDAGLSSATHSTLRHEDKKSAPVPLFTFVLNVLFLAIALLFSQRLLNLLTVVIRAGSSDMESLRRGIALYRRFG